ncbi:GIN domain-containing protein [Novacetimonas pomaceti]|uniref:GIN domain-containing protein n=1 Tax=Novacetimonas pomaceti TaxID=2021998 RepID=UPI001C2DEB67|nr:DUF2807 domain-containing protein [Novacetimonas pomaceti]MBV1833619.1 DUF2807 domain-containing protein [Novacetimonas pomaceti]
MIRGITMIAVGGAALSLACFGVASSRAPTGFPFLTFDAADDDTTPPAATRVLPWQGGHVLEIDLPARVVYQQGPLSSITVAGSERMVRAVTLDGDSLGINNSLAHNINFGWHNRKLTVTVTAPELDTLNFNGFGSLYLRDYHQPTLTLEVNGAASVKGNGRADNVKLSLDGAGSIDLTAMEMTDLDASIDGAGSVKAGPTGHASVSIDGAGSVKLTRAPASLSKQIDGIGSVSVPPAGKPAHVDTSRPLPPPSDQEDDEKISM